MIDLGTLPGGDQSTAHGINENGEVIGDSYLASSEDIHCVPVGTAGFDSRA